MNGKCIKKCIFSIFMLVCPFLSVCDVVELNWNNFGTTIENNRFVFVNFFAPWCRFSVQLEPIFKEASDAIGKQIIEPNTVAFGKVNCDAQRGLSVKYNVKKYPTLKLFRDGKLVKQEYRGERSVQSLVDYILDNLRGGVKEFHSLKELSNLASHRRTVIGYFETRDSISFANFENMAKKLRDDCDFYVGFGNVSLAERTTGDNVVYRYRTEYYPELVYMGSLRNYELLLQWTEKQCVPLVREITYYNAEELTEEGLTFFVVFHKREDTESLDIFQKEAAKLVKYRSSFNFLSADCEAFVHPLFHLSKSVADCPLVILDSFQHMYLFPSFNLVTKPGMLEQFLLDYQSGKLHREFHHGPDPVVEQPSTSSTILKIRSSVESTPEKGKKSEKMQEVMLITRESVFKNLKPSEHRYSFDRRDEL